MRKLSTSTIIWEEQSDLFALCLYPVLISSLAPVLHQWLLCSAGICTSMLTAKSTNGLNSWKRETPSSVFIFMAAKCSHCLVLISLGFFSFVCLFFSFQLEGWRKQKREWIKSKGKEWLLLGSVMWWGNQAETGETRLDLSHTGRPWIVSLWQWSEQWQ